MAKMVGYLKMTLLMGKGINHWISASLNLVINPNVLFCPIEKPRGKHDA